MPKKRTGKVGFFRSPQSAFTFSIFGFFLFTSYLLHPNSTRVDYRIQMQGKTDYDPNYWTEIREGPGGILLDLRYADTANFVGEKMYECGRCFLRPKAAQALRRVARKAFEYGFRLLLLDCYRPRPVQQQLWDMVPDARYVTPPARGSMHNRGLAIDLTFADMWGKEVDMGTPYDFFGKEAWYEYRELPDSTLQRRKRLRALMEEAGFKGIRTEWWHFSFSKAGGQLDDWVWPCLKK